MERSQPHYSGSNFFLALNLYLEKSIQLGIYVVSKLYFLKMDCMYIDGVIIVFAFSKQKLVFHLLFYSFSILPP